MPTLTVVAGPNGAGKTRLSPFLKHAQLISVTPLNTDQIRNFINDSELSFDLLRLEEQSRKQVNEIFLNEAKKAIDNRIDFSFESNISSLFQLGPVKLFDDAGYRIHLIYICLDSIDKSQQRVVKRSVHENGHFVTEEKVKLNFTGGLSILNQSFSDWDRVFLLDNNADIDSTQDELEVLLVAEKGEIIFFKKGPSPRISGSLPNVTESIARYKRKKE